MEQKVTLRHIAQEVGLSPTAVSLVLNNRPCRISEENRRRIREIAAREHYVPNQIARSLVMRESKTLGLIVPNIESRFFASLAGSLERRCRAKGYALFITNSDGKPENDLDLVRLLVRRGVDGLFVVAADELEPSTLLAQELDVLNIPLLLVDRTIEGASCSKVCFDHELGGYMATRYLIDKGHKQIACMVNAERSMTGRLRLAGYKRALSEAGIALNPHWILQSEYYIPDAYRAAEQVVSTGASAVFASSDNIALGLLRRLYEQGLRIPRDYSVVSYDNSAADALFEPALTSIEQSVEELAGCAIEVMFELFEAQAPSKIIERVLPPHLVEHRSVAVLQES